jgi:hypothetical protein
MAAFAMGTLVTTEAGSAEGREFDAEECGAWLEVGVRRHRLAIQKARCRITNYQ